MYQVAALRFLGVAAAGAPVVGQTARCIAYMCPWAHACPTATPRPAAIESRRCARHRPEDHRPRAGLSDHALDVLASQRRKGEPLGRATGCLLDTLRPAGPSRSFALRRPSYPALPGPPLARARPGTPATA